MGGSLVGCGFFLDFVLGTVCCACGKESDETDGSDLGWTITREREQTETRVSRAETRSPARQTC